MVSVRRPPTETIRAFLAAQAKLDLTYAAVGATGGEAPAGYVVDHTRVRLGRGAADFARARAALERWGQFDLGWVEAWSPATPIRTGEVVAVMSRQFGLWWLSACRLVHVVDEGGDAAGPVARFGFAYGTLPDHAGAGEERFLVEWDRGSDEVWYDIRAFSRPRWLVSRLGYPYMRRLQKRFGRESAAAMQRAVAGGESVP
jgi:uncharacterized protein (UPF0548 family)